MNLDAEARIVSTDYQGEPFGKAICQKIVYERDGQQIKVISGIERSFVLDVAKMLYGDAAEDEMDLVLSTMEVFGVEFWITLIYQMTRNITQIDVRENHFILGSALRGELQALQPNLSVLLSSEHGKFFLCTDSASVFLPEKNSA